MSTFSKEYASGFKNRLVEAMGDESAHSVAKRAEISYTAFRGYLDGSVPGADKANQIAKALKISVAWLVAGEGDKYEGFASKEQNANAQMTNFHNDLKAITPDIVEKAVASLYEYLERNDREIDARSFGVAAALLCEMAAASGGFNQGLVDRLSRLPPEKSR